MITKAEAIKSLDSTAEFIIMYGDTDVITWIKGEIPQAEITAEVTRLQTIYDNNQYQRDRQYAPTGDQLDMLWHSIDAGEFGDTAKQSEFYIANKAVKDANPKP